MTKHTANSWEVDGRYVVNADHHLFSKLSNVPEEEIEANLRLAAAAPELLEALKTLIDMDVAYQRGDKVAQAVDAAKAAIAKAEGKSK